MQHFRVQDCHIHSQVKLAHFGVQQAIIGALLRLLLAWAMQRWTADQSESSSLCVIAGKT